MSFPQYVLPPKSKSKTHLSVVDNNNSQTHKSLVLQYTLE